jgi:hypothetical protein
VARRRFGIGHLLILASIVLFAFAVSHIFKLLQTGRTYFCVGQGCPYQTPDAAHDMYWVIGTLPFAIALFVFGAIALQFRRSMGGASDLHAAQSTDAWGTKLRSAVAGPTWTPDPSGGLSILGWAFLVMGGLFIAGGIAFPAPRIGFLITGGIFLPVAILMLVGSRGGRSLFADSERLKLEGIAGRAWIQGLEQTGVWLNNNPMVSMNLRVELPGRDPYVTRHREFVPQVLLARQWSGQPMDVAVDPNDPNRLVIRWETVAPPSTPPSAS